MEEDGCQYFSGEEEETFHPVEVYDPVYEFDAARFFDFSRPETYAEAQEAERWFDTAPSYSTSPFVVKLNRNWRWTNEEIHPRDASGMSSSSGFKDEEGAYYCSCRGREHIKESEISSSAINSKDSSKVGTKSSSRSSTLLKPTVSYLAKLNQNREVQFQRLLRSPRALVKDAKQCLQSSFILQNYAPKRQKLEAGYLRKVAHLKHCAPFPHKLSKEGFEPNVGSVRRKPKVTVPREPHLETAQRAQRHRLKNCAESAECTKSKYNTSKECQVASKAVSRSDSPPIARNETTDDLRSILQCDAEQENSEKTNKSRVCPPKKKDSKSLIEKVHPDPPTDLFQELSLRSEAQRSGNFQSNLPQHTRVLKENSPKVLQAELEANCESKIQLGNNTKEKPQQFGGKQCRCAGEALISEMKNTRTMNFGQ